MVMTVIGADRPGIVGAVARLVAEHGGNWLESRMCRLGGQFAGILRVTAPAEQRAALARALEGMSAQGLTVVAQDDRAADSPPPTDLTVLEVLGQDRPGIIREIAAALARLQVNVEELVSEVVSAPMSGEPLFKARATVLVPTATPAATLRRELEKIAADLQVDLTVQPLTSRPG
jgi:glycine cleavage system regulatory protein